MKRILLIFAFVLSYILADAQFYGGFGCGDPNAWFNKEIYFYCQNVANNGYYGINLNNVSFVIDGTTQVDLDGQWLYQDVVFLGQDNGFKFSKGSTVGIFVNGQYYGSWTCIAIILRQRILQKDFGTINQEEGRMLGKVF